MRGKRRARLDPEAAKQCLLDVRNNVDAAGVWRIMESIDPASVCRACVESHV